MKAKRLYAVNDHSLVDVKNDEEDIGVTRKIIISEESLQHISIQSDSRSLVGSTFMKNGTDLKFSY